MAVAGNGKGTHGKGSLRFPEFRPRKPRQRAAKRRVAKPGDRSEPRDVECFEFSAVQLDELHIIFGSRAATDEQQSDLRARLDHIASQHLHWRGQPSPSKSEARYQIEMLAYLAGRIEGNRSGIAKARQEFFETLDDLNDLARAALWQQVGEHAVWPDIAEKAGHRQHVTPMEYLDGEAVDVDFVGDCAVSLATRLKTRGDYRDLDLALSVAELVELFEDWTGTKATSSVWRGRGRNRTKDEYTPVAQCTRFVAQFFAIVDPDIGPSKPVNALRQLLAPRSKAARNSPA